MKSATDETLPNSHRGSTPFNWRRWLWFGLAIAVAIGMGLLLKWLPMREELRFELSLAGFVCAFIILLAEKFRQRGKQPPQAADWSQILAGGLCVVVSGATKSVVLNGAITLLGLWILGDILERWDSKNETKVVSPEPPASA